MRIDMKYVLIITLCLVACKSRPNHYDVKLQDGTAGYRLDCDKTEFSVKDCLDEAARVCHGSAVVMDDANNGINTIVRCQK
jgi:hypothetical protein